MPVLCGLVCLLFSVGCQNAGPTRSTLVSSLNSPSVGNQRQPVNQVKKPNPFIDFSHRDQPQPFHNQRNSNPLNTDSNYIRPASFQDEERAVGSSPESNTRENVGEDATRSTDLVGLDNVVQSVFNHFPEVTIALNEIQTASGKALAAQGAFDSQLSSHSTTQPLGFYETQRFGLGVAQPLFGGGEVYGTYRIGDGNFEPWYGERETDEGGEFKAGFSLPLVKNRVIDKRRAKLFQADINLALVEADVDARFLIFKRLATQAYWDTRIAADLVRIQTNLLSLAKARVDQIKKRIGVGDLPDIAEIDNQRFIAKRENDLFKARRKFEKAAIKLSIFLRDQSGDPYIIKQEQLPNSFPAPTVIGDDQLANDIRRGLSLRPELDVLRNAEEFANVDLQLAQNTVLPKFDVKATAGQDVGGLTSKKGDKQPFELAVGFLAEVPLQRREGLGKIDAALGKLGQIRAKLRMQADKIRLEIQDAASAINAAYAQIEQSSKNLDLTQEALRLGRIAFDKGDIGLIELNIYETSVAGAELQLLDARYEFLFFKAVYDNAIRASVE